MIQQDALPKTDYFSWENFQELANLDGHIAFAQQLMDRYTWPEEAAREMQGRLDQIRAKQQDQQLNMSVIGEFTSGKSTFINALLRRRMLAECVLQGTTVAATVLEYGDTPRIQCTLENGDQHAEDAPDLQTLGDKINRLAANNEDARKISSVHAQLPVDWLRDQHFRIIDTPGLNALTQWHEAVTVRTLEDISDVSIILTDAGKPMPEDLCNFIQEHLSHILPQCVFVITKFDTLRPRERERMLQYVENKVKLLGVEQPLVLPYAALDLLDAFEEGADEQLKTQGLAALSLETEQKIFAHMAKCRAMAQSKKLISLVDKMYRGVNEKMQDLTRDCEERIAALEQARTKDLAAFLAQQKETRSQEFDSRSQEKADFIHLENQNRGASLSETINTAIVKVTAIDQLEGEVNKLNKDVEKTAKEMNRMAMVNVEKRCGRQLYHEVCAAFRREFRDQFAALKALNVHSLTADSQMRYLELPAMSGLDQLQSSNREAVRVDNTTFWGTVAGAAGAGAVVGAGIPGAIVGGLVGLFTAGRIREKRLEEQKQKVATAVKSAHKQYFDQAVILTDQQVNTYLSQVQDHIKQEIDRYYETYRATVEQRLQEEKANRQALEGQLTHLKKDSHDIDLRRQALHSLIDHMQ